MAARLLDEGTVRRAVTSIAERGYVELPDFVPAPILDEIWAVIEPALNAPSINGQGGYVKAKDQRYLLHTLTYGRAILDIYTDPSIIELAERYVEGEVHLTNYRIYQSLPSATRHRRWHVDNKVDVYDAATGHFIHTVLPDDKGLILIVYLSDVEDGGFQIVTGSHLWSHLHDREDWDGAEADFIDRVVTFNDRPRGTSIVYDTRAIHRPKPYAGGRVRTSLFAQYSSPRMPAGEPVVLNARDLAGLSAQQMRVLAFGRVPTLTTYPVGKPADILEDLGLA